MNRETPALDGDLMHIVTLNCKDAESADSCISALAAYGKPDALAYNCASYEFGRREGSEDTVYIIERWRRWSDLDALLNEKVVPALPMYNQLLKRPFDPSQDTLRICLSAI